MIRCAAALIGWTALVAGAAAQTSPLDQQLLERAGRDARGYVQGTSCSTSNRVTTEITCSATYWNVRRFEASARFVTPK